MASSLAKSNKGYRRSESRNKHSWWWDSHISPKNSKWLAENVEEMDHSVKRMLKLIEEDGDSFAKKAEMYYQKRPKLVSHVEEFYRMYRSLAERYDNVTGELRKNIPSDLQSQGSGVSGVSDVGSDPSPGFNNNPRARLGNRAAGFDVFLKSGGSSSDLGTKEGDDTSTLDSESESDDSSVNNYSSVSGNDDHSVLRKRITELETELRKYESMVTQSDDVKEEKIRVLESDMNIVTKKLNDSKEEVKRLRYELENNGPSGNNLQAQKEISGWKSKLEKEKREALRLQDRITRYKTSLSERDREIRAMRETLSNANKTLSEENTQLQEQVTKLLKEQAFLSDTLKEWELRCQNTDEELRRMKVVKVEMEGEIKKLKFEKNELTVKVNELDRELTLKDGQLDGLSWHLGQLQLEHVELVDQISKSNKSIDELTSRGEELEKEISRQQEVIIEGAEEKREVIRQLCFSLEHYRDGYQMMRRAFMGHNKRHPVAAS
ncbi:protein NETWORKED 4A-like [Bidens hawaiensis]|uniref:protein NETWORKED 4A-like n=1 Tax=Bidens hawaiensis TaxID=980011 RepID=UPI00404B7C1D